MYVSMMAGVVALLQSVAGQSLTLDNFRTPNGIYGTSRPANQPLLPGDLALITFELSGLKVVGEARAVYGVGLTLVGPDGKVLVEQEPRATEALLPLGGGKIPAFVAVELPIELPAGSYTVNLRATDYVGKTEGKATRKIEVSPKRFGIVRVTNSFVTGDTAPNYALPGQQFVLRFSLAHCTLDPKTLRCKTQLRIRLLDENGVSLNPKPFVTEIQDVLEETTRVCPCTYPIQPNRPGRFQIEIEAIDQLAAVPISAKIVYPLVVIEPK